MAAVVATEAVAEAAAAAEAAALPPAAATAALAAHLRRNILTLVGQAGAVGGRKGAQCFCQSQELVPWLNMRYIPKPPSIWGKTIWQWRKSDCGSHISLKQ